MGKSPTIQKINVCPAPGTTLTLTPKWHLEDGENPLRQTSYALLINGERTFAAIASAIENATKSIDIAMWGYDPDMYLIRDGSIRTRTLEDLLEEAAERKVIVRFLIYAKKLLALSAWAQIYPEKSNYFEIRERAPTFHNINSILESSPFKDYGVQPISLLSDQYYGLNVAPSFHEKLILIDYEDPTQAVGFIMGHNLKSEYWDNDEHSSVAKEEDSGRDGDKPYQDNSSCVYGDVLYDMNAFFTKAWDEEKPYVTFQIGNSPIHNNLQEQRKHIESSQFVRNPEAYAERIKNINEKILNGKTLFQMQPILGQFLRSHAKDNVFDIFKAHMEVIKRARRYIYIENQYFRFPPIAEMIKQAAEETYNSSGKPLYLFVVIMNPDRNGTYNTWQMLNALGQSDGYPEIKKRFYDDEGKSILRKFKIPSAYNDDLVYADDIVGLKTHICTLVSLDSPAGKSWQDVYVHSKLMLVDDTCFIQGSANINLRSMTVDGETAIFGQNIDQHNVVKPIRQHLWDIHTNHLGNGDDMEQVYKAWNDIIKENKDRNTEESAPYAPLIAFEDKRTQLWQLD